MKFTTDTHQTRCGAPWRALDINTGSDELVAGITDHTDREYIFVISESGAARKYGQSFTCEEYDLIPIRREHNLPTSLPMEARWASRDTGGVFIYQDRPFFHERIWSNPSAASYHKLGEWLYGDSMLKDFKPEDSLHKRTDDGGWEHTEK